jgi:hypothetical protein
MPIKKCVVTMGAAVIVCSAAISFRSLTAAQHEKG